MFISRLWVLVMLMVFTGSPVAENIHSMWVLTDPHLDTHTTHHMALAPSGRYLMNDLDGVTFQALLRTLADGLKQGLVPKPDFILILGDLTGHQRRYSDTVISSQQACVNAMTEYFPATPVFYVFGNNDSFVQNYGPSTRQNIDVLSTHTRCARHHATYPCVLDENKADGYYSAYVYPGLRLIALNSVMFSPRAQGVTQTQIDTQFDWLKQQLIAAQHEHVLLTMHIPPGDNVYNKSSFWTARSSARFMHLLTEHADHTIAVLAGHSHKDEVKILHDANHKPILGVFLNPALSTSHGNAPAIRSYSLTGGPEHWRIANYTTYFFGLTSLEGGNALGVHKLYDFNAYYCQPGETALNECLSHVTADKMARYFSAGNMNFHDTVSYPSAINLNSRKQWSWFKTE